MSVKVNRDIFTVMKERASVRQYEKGIAIPEQELREILQAATTAPSSWNLQHWKFLVIQSEKNKQILLPIAFNQQQVVDSSVVVAVLGDLEANKNADAVYSEAVANGFMTEEVKDVLLNQINGAYTNQQFARDEAVLNPSLAAMQLMLAAKAKGYDSCPMGGFDRQKFVETFHVPDRYIPVMLITIGKAVKPAHQTARFSLDRVIVKESF
ncbi:putative NAD(P)H nitroreductase YodC [Marinithermofilum abyssi]|uniref:Putative NAD(P)H nitroreductase YodC n=1 Tax=Marinithermofilum abyssi TaxID=1571185 RepID=A0A8J2VIR6_9BACL|nr:nitroreductase family protein [Marinithermofilum abyssi]GGE24210.1 putative NAD(P)H nitroreductase YodC [Marinithermofilum abyssi]